VLLDGYVRVSQVAGRGGESFISPAVQREQIEGWIGLHGHTVGRIFEELDESGARADRPMLMEALARAEGGASQGIVVAKLDRFGRSLVDGLANIERLSAPGGVFISVQDGLDLSTPTGKLMVRIMLSMAEWELDRIRDNWAVARSRAIDRGLHLTLAPVGYRKVSGRLVPDEPAAAVVTRLFERRAAGVTLRALLHELNSSGLAPGRGGSEFVEGSLRGILANRTYLGEVRSGPFSNASAHPALVDRATWQLAQAPLRFQSNRRTSLLGGLLRCAGCRMKMSVESGVYRHGTHGSVYRCPGTSSLGRCPAPARLRSEEIEGIVEDDVLRGDPPAGRERGIDRRLRTAGEEVARAEGALVRYRDGSGALTVLTPENFARGLAKRQGDVEDATLALAAARQARGVVEPLGRDLAATWSDLTIEQRRAALERNLDCLFVTAGDGPVLGRVMLCPRGLGPTDLPRRGEPLRELRGFDPRTCPGARRLRAPRRLSPARIERELRAWRGGERRWPTYVEFLRDGHARLHHQVLGYGGVRYWARRLAWIGAPRPGRWGPEEIRAGLRPIVAGRAEWPSKREFEALGLGGLRRAVIRSGGIEHWAREHGLASRPGTAHDRLATAVPVEV
jgi:DNA invertase Pin-like site-specific DNA recombinase